MDITADELINMFDMSIEKIGSKEGICKFLDILSRNPELDFMDAVNIYTQFPDGKMLNTYRGWDKEYGRHIKRWEKGIKAIEYIEQEMIDDDGEIYDICSVPKLINKYDISQTQGKAVDKFNMDRCIRNKKCQGEFKVLLNGIIKELQKEMGLPLNSFSGLCSKHVLLMYYGISDKEFDKHMEKYFFQCTDSVNYFLGELFDVLDKTYDKLKNGHSKVIASLAAVEPGVENSIEEAENKAESVEMPEKKPASIEMLKNKAVSVEEAEKKAAKEMYQSCETKKDTAVSKQEKTVASASTVQSKANSKRTTEQAKKKVEIQTAPVKSSLLNRLRIKVKEAKIYNSERMT